MTTTATTPRAAWPTAIAVALPLAWFAVLALAIWLGSNGARPIAAWFVAYPMFALYPSVAALAASRSDSPGMVRALATITPMTALLWALLDVIVEDTPRGTGFRPSYGLAALVTGLGLYVGIGRGDHLMRAGRPIAGFAVASLVFLIPTILAFFFAMIFGF